MSAGQAFFDAQSLRATFNGVLYGILLLAILINVQRWRVTRHSRYAYFVLFLIFVLFGMISVNVAWYGTALSGVTEQIGIFQKIFLIGMFASAFLFTTHLFPKTMQLVRHRREVNILFISIIFLLIALGFLGVPSSLFWCVLYFLFLFYASLSLGLSFYSFSRTNNWHHGLLVCSYLILSLVQWFSFDIAFKSLPVGVFDLAWWQLGLILHLVIVHMALFIDGQPKKLSRTGLQNQALASSDHRDLENTPDRDLSSVIERLIHDFKTPLAVIDSSVQSLGMLDHANTAEHAARYQRIRRAVTRMNDLLMHSLNTNRSNLTSSTEARQHFDLPTLMEASIAEFAAYDFASNQDVVIRLDPNRQEQVQWFKLYWREIDHPQSIRLEGNFELLRVALSHFFEKVFKHDAINSEVSVMLRKLKLSSGLEMVDISIRHSDESTTFDADYQKIANSALQNLTSHNDSGADLGLKIARQVIEEHGGVLNMQLTHANCIAFQFQLPLISD